MPTKQVAEVAPGGDQVVTFAEALAPWGIREEGRGRGRRCEAGEVGLGEADEAFDLGGAHAAVGEGEGALVAVGAFDREREALLRALACFAPELLPQRSVEVGPALEGEAAKQSGRAVGGEAGG